MRNVPYLSQIDYSKRILEIGPLDKPLVSKGKGPAVFYADIRNTEGVRQLYANDRSVDITAICPIDFRIESSYRESLTDTGTEPFHYIIGSHIIEHIPLLLDFFPDIASAMDDGGMLCLTIPDHRYCFDHFRMPTSFAEMYDIHVHGITRTAHRVLDHALDMSSNNNATFYWNADTSDALPEKSFSKAKELYEAFLSGKYCDVHFSVFTPISFILILHDMHRAALNPFMLADFYPTERNSFEFHVVLRKDKELPSNAKKIAQEIIKLKNVLAQLQRIEFESHRFPRK